MSDIKTKDTKRDELGSLTKNQIVAATKSTALSCGPNEAKIVSIGQVSEKKKLELIKQIVKTTPSF